MASRREELQVALTATDKLSKVVDKAAKAVDDLDGETAEVEVTADTERAEESIEAVDKGLTNLDGESAEARVAVLTADAEAELDAMMRRLQDLEDEEVVAVLTGKATQLEALIKDANAQLASVDGRSAEAIVAVKDEATAKLRVIRSRIDGLNDGLRNVNKSGDQSRSVLANLAGNSAQDLGELGGVVGSLGVGIGQLAEYAVDGNISMANLAKVAGPMLGLAAALHVVNTAVADSKKRAEEAQAAYDEVSNAIQGNSTDFTNFNQLLRETTLLWTASDEPGTLERVLELLPVVNGLVGEMDDETRQTISTLHEAGISIDEWTNAITGGLTPAADMTTKLGELRDQGVITADEYDNLLSVFSRQSGVYAEVIADQALMESVFASTTRSIQEQLDAANAAADPLSVMSETWATLIEDAKDGVFDFENAAGAIDQLAEATGMSTDEIIRRIQVEAAKALEDEAEAAAKVADELGELNSKYALSNEAAGGYATALGEVADAARDNADAIRDETVAALEAEQEALEETIEALEGYIDAQRDAYDSQIDYREATEDAEDALADYEAVLADTESTSEDAAEAGEDLVAAVLAQSDALIAQKRAQAAANGEIYSGTQAIEDQNAALLATAATIPDELLPQFAEMITTINGIPEEKETILTMLREGVDPAVILDHLNSISGTHAAAVQVEADQQAIANVANQLAILTKPKYVKIIPSYGGGLSSKTSATGVQTAVGGVATLVGEQGPELVTLPTGASVTPAGQTAEMMSAGGGGSVVNNYTTVNVPAGTTARDLSKAYGRRLRTQGPYK